jgi:hypothetical protein
VHAARRYAGLACLALALSAGACGCSQPDDIVVSVQPELVDGGTMMMGSGGVIAGTGGVTAGSGGITSGSGGITSGAGGAPNAMPECELPDWVDEAVRLASPDAGCRIPHDDPLVTYAENLYKEQKGQNDAAPPVGEGTDVTRCEVDLTKTWMWPYYQDENHPDEYTLCPIWCQIVRVNAAAALQQFRECMTRAMMQQP